jgi:outer membrane receptor protein involved in Fe transport
LKLRLQFDAKEKTSLGATVNYSSDVYARGDENNQDVNGRIPGYSVVNLDGRYNITQGLEVFARITNLFDRRYANFGALGQNFFAGAGHSFDGLNPVNEQFRGPGVPRGIWLGLRYHWL